MTDPTDDIHAELARERDAKLNVEATKCLDTHYGEAGQEYPLRLIETVKLAYQRGAESTHESLQRMADEALRYKRSFDATTDQLKATQDLLKLIQIFEQRLPHELRPKIKAGIDPDWEIPF